MSKIVSARIENELQERLRDKCNNLGCTINDYLVGMIELILNGSTEYTLDDKYVITRKDELTFPCCVCGGKMTANPESLRQAFKNWGHASCINKKRYV
jgi:predicted DNA-binding protein